MKTTEIDEFYKTAKFVLESDYGHWEIPVKDLFPKQEIIDINEDYANGILDESDFVWEIEDLGWESLTSNMRFKLVM